MPWLRAQRTLPRTRSSSHPGLFASNFWARSRVCVPTLHSMSPPTLSRHVVEKIRRSRRHPRPTQFDYLHLRYIVDHLAAAISEIEPPPKEVLDVYCGARPYDDLLPPGSHCVGLDIDESY